MTNDRRPGRFRARALLPLLVLVLVAGAAVGAYYDWYLWHPMSAVAITMVAAVLVLVGGLAAAINARRVRPIGLLLVAAGLGAVLGSVINPTRPVVERQDGGSIRMVLTAPAAFDASGDGDCGSARDASQVVVSPGEFGLARSTEDADFHYVYLTIGDMYDFGRPTTRSDHLSLVIEVQSATVSPDFDDPNARPGFTRHASDASSTLTLTDHSRSGGTLAFANLAMGDPAGSAGRSAFAGTVTWTCGPVIDFERPPAGGPDAEPRESPPPG